MNEPITYRIVGAIVLMALAVIFVPMLLDGSGRKEVTTVNIDDIPDTKYVFSKPVETIPLPGKSAVNDAQKPVAKKEKSAVDPAEVEPAQKTEVVSEVTVAADTPDVLRSWVIQVAALSSKEKADALRTQLLQHKFDAFVERSGSGTKAIYRVKVGPVLKESSAKALLAQIEKQLGIKNLLIKRHPEKSNESS